MPGAEDTSPAPEGASTPPVDGPSTSEAPVSRSGRESGAPERHHASDQVFRELAAAILGRELSPDAPLPPERELSERFGVSRIVVREAIHRLKEYELVRVRQGSPTMVLDPDRATDMRLLGLEIELTPPSPSGIGVFIERQAYSGAALLDLAEQRMTPEETDALDLLVDEFLASAEKQAAWLSFERTFWTSIARGTQNRLYLRETLWYFNLLEKDPRFLVVFSADPLTRARGYKALVGAIRNRSNTAALYLGALRANRV
jgi:DNA-binding FadR family transcriptional regulator